MKASKIMCFLSINIYILMHRSKLPLLSTPNGGKGLLDKKIVSLWQQADQHEFEIQLSQWTTDSEEKLKIRASLTSLVEA